MGLRGGHVRMERDSDDGTEEKREKNELGDEGQGAEDIHRVPSLLCTEHVRRTTGTGDVAHGQREQETGNGGRRKRLNPWAELAGCGAARGTLNAPAPS